MKIGVYSAKAAAISGTSVWETPSGKIVTCTVTTDTPESIAWDDKVVLGPVKRLIRTIPAPNSARTYQAPESEPGPKHRGLLSRLFH